MRNHSAILTVVFTLQHGLRDSSERTKSELNPMDSGAQLRAQQSNSPTHSRKDMNIAYARQSEHFKVSAQDVQMFSLAISSEAKL